MSMGLYQYAVSIEAELRICSAPGSPHGGVVISRQQPLRNPSIACGAVQRIQYELGRGRGVS